MMMQNNITTCREFKTECRNYFFYISKINSILEKKRGIEYRMEGVHSIDFQKLPGTKGASNYDCRLGLMDIKKQLDEQSQDYLNRLEYILDVFNAFPVRAYRVIGWKAYIQGDTVTSIAEKLGVSPDSLLKELKNQVNAALQIINRTK